MDAVEGVLADFERQPPAVLASLATPLPEDLRQQLKQVTARTPLAEAMRLDCQLADLFAATATELMRSAGVPAADVVAIGNHGQTLWHSPDSEPAWTLQVGDPNRIALQTGVTTVADFRRMDMAAGGEGAPLVPIFHNAMFRSDQTRVVVNLGGIANITVLPGDSRQPVSGFDTGPANTLLDAWAWRYLQTPCDQDGQWAAGGKAIPELLQALRADPYFSQLPPKSTGPEYFNLGWLGCWLEESYRPVDVQATLVQLTATTVAAAVREHAADTTEVIACGGGVHNPILMTSLAASLAPIKLTTTADYGIAPDKVEAMCFAWLARERLADRPGNLSTVTGAERAVVLGGIYSAH